MTENEIKTIEEAGRKENLLRQADRILWTVRKDCENASKEEWKDAVTVINNAHELLDDAKPHGFWYTLATTCADSARGRRTEAPPTC